MITLFGSILDSLPHPQTPRYGITSDEALALGAALLGNGRLTAVDLSGNRIRGAATAADGGCPYMGRRYDRGVQIRPGRRYERPPHGRRPRRQPHRGVGATGA